MSKISLFVFANRIYGKRFRMLMATVWLIGLILAAVEFVLTWMLGQIVDNVALGEQAVINNFLLLSAAVVIQVITLAAYSKITGRIKAVFIYRLRAQIADKLCNAKYSSIEMISDGNLLSVCSSDTEGFKPWLDAVFALGQLPVKTVLVCIALMFISWKIFVGMLILLPIAMFPELLLSKRLHSSHTKERQSNAAMLGFLNSAVRLLSRRPKAVRMLTSISNATFPKHKKLN